MVEQIDTQTVIKTIDDEQKQSLSIKRWLRHIFYFKSSKRLFNHLKRQQITAAITQAEAGHRGEIQVVIEASLPSTLALKYTTRQRAEQLFAEYRVWDTEYNTGILIYLNLCDHAIEIVVDRGINQAISTDYWQKLCQDLLFYFQKNQFTEGLCWAIVQLGDRLAEFYKNDADDPKGNELENEPKLIC